MGVENVRNALFNSAQEFLTGADTITTNVGTYTDLPTIDFSRIAFENRKLRVESLAPADEIWASVDLLPATNDARALGRTGVDESTGILQISLHIPFNTGHDLFTPWLQKSGLYFHGGRSFADGTERVSIRSVSFSPAIELENWWMKALSVPYWAHVKRQYVTT